MKNKKLNNKFIVIDATIGILMRGLGSPAGNLELLNLKEDEIEHYYKDNNYNENLRLINSLLETIRDLKERCELYEREL